MSLTIGKRDIKAMTALLDEEWDDVEDLAAELLRTAWGIYEARAQYTVVGQLWKDEIGQVQDPDRLNTTAVGVYPTEVQATNSARSLTYSAQTHETFRAMVVPIWWGTPATFYAERKRIRDEAEAAERTGRYVPDQVSA